jgi:hypothetical protein
MKSILLLALTLSSAAMAGVVNLPAGGSVRIGDTVVTCDSASDPQVISRGCECIVTERDPNGGNTNGSGLQAELYMTEYLSNGQQRQRVIGIYRNDAFSWAEQVCESHRQTNPLCH